MLLKAAWKAAGCSVTQTAVAAMAAMAATAASGLAQAQGQAPSAAASAPAVAPSGAPVNSPVNAPVSAAKQALVARVLQLQQPGIEGMARGMVEQPALQILQQAGAAMQRVPAERREALARDIQGDVRKYVEDTAPGVSNRAVALSPSTIGALLADRFTEDELRQVVTLLESPVNRKFQQLAPDMQRALSEKLVADTRGQVEANVRGLEQSVGQRLSAAAPAPAASGTADGRSGGKAPRAAAAPAGRK